VIVRTTISFDGSKEQPTRLPRSVGEALSGVETATAVSTDMPGRARVALGSWGLKPDAHGETPYDLREVACVVVGCGDRNGGFHRHAGTGESRVGVAGAEADAHGETPYDLREVACVVVG